MAGVLHNILNELHDSHFRRVKVFYPYAGKSKKLPGKGAREPVINQDDQGLTI